MESSFSYSTVAQNTKLSDKHESLSSRQNTWPSEIVKVYRERKPPLYTSEDNIRLNVQSIAYVQAIKNVREKMQRGLEKPIADCKISIQGFHSELSGAMETSRAKMSLAMYVRHPEHHRCRNFFTFWERGKSFTKFLP